MTAFRLHNDTSPLSRSDAAEKNAAQMAKQSSQLVFHQLVTVLLESVEHESEDSTSEDMFNSFLAENISTQLMEQGAGKALSDKIDHQMCTKIASHRAYQEMSRNSTLSMEASA